MRLKIAICDDEAEEADRVAGLAAAWSKESFHTAELRRYASAEAFLCDYDEEKDFDILLLDIEMKGISGIELAKGLRRDKSRVEIIFLTSHTEFYGEGYEVDALHFLIKPIDGGKLYPVLDRAALRLAAEPPYIVVCSEKETVKLYESEICYIESSLHYVLFVTDHGQYKVREKLSDVERRLSDRFFRTHRSYLVSLEHIRRISRGDVLMDNKDVVPLARGRYDEINRAYISAFSHGNAGEV